MRAMILAAGRGERMRPLTDSRPKPLLRVGGVPLIAWHIRRLVQAGIVDIIVNHCWLGQQIETELGDGAREGARIVYSPEAQALETAGGIVQALEFFEGKPFLVVNGDIWCDWTFEGARERAAELESRDQLAWLLLTDNPAHHPHGDFTLAANGRVGVGGADPTLTFAGIGIYRNELFAGLSVGAPAPLAPLLKAAILDERVIGTQHRGHWVDVGTPQRLAALNERLTGH